VTGLKQRELQAQERRKQLIEVASRLFAEKGMENTSIKDISTEAGVAQGLIYHYFRSKEDLLWAIISQYNPISEIAAIFADAGDRPARKVLPEAAYKALDLVSTRSDLQNLVRIVLREALIRPEMQHAFRLMQALGIGFLTRYLEARIAAGELRPHNPDVTARMVIGSIALLHLTGAASESLVPEVVESLLQGIEMRQP
jgi:AcrR family transcriptional regulator